MQNAQFKGKRIILKQNKGKSHKEFEKLLAEDLGIRIFPKANIYGGPLIASHVGSDVSADLLAIGMDEMEENVMLVDIGTNTEVIIGNKDRILAASCPAGPAFEGGEIKFCQRIDRNIELCVASTSIS